jgi:hypothetical protein
VIRGWVLAAVLGLLPADDAARTVTFVSVGRPAAELLADAGAMLAPDALDRGRGFRPLAVAALRVSSTTAWQALAHATDLDWLPMSGGGAWLLAAERPPAGRLRSRTWTGAGPRPLALERQVRAILDPWLVADAGIALDPLSGAWSATLDEDGLARLESLVAALEDDTPRIPARVVPPPPEGRIPDLEPGDWQRLAADLVDAGVPAVAVHPALLSASAPAVAAGLIATLPDRLGVPAAWIDGCLCIGQPRPRLHPSRSAQVAVLPVAHLRRSAGELAPLIESAVPRRSGWGVVSHPAGGSLVLVADADTIHAVLDLLDQRERDGALLRP